MSERILHGHVKNRRISHAYLLTGGSEAERARIAREFAQALNCLKQKVFEACDCVSCAKIRNENHPDVFFLGGDPKVRSIKIEEVRRAISAAALKPYEGHWKVFVFEEADRLSPSAANALLKTLEEPLGQTVFMLLTEQRANLPDTVQSRCFEVRLPPVQEGAETPAREFQSAHWEDFFEEYQGLTREELIREVGGWMESLRMQLRKNAGAPATEFRKRLQALDFLLEAKEALDDNVNQKLALTRLTMRLKQLET